MNIVYSAFREIVNPPHLEMHPPFEPHTNEEIDRCIAYQTACIKYSKEIGAIQKYFPGWLPASPIST